jgi:pimeloyl-ACP methyl ester carboxylesterase
MAGPTAIWLLLKLVFTPEIMSADEVGQLLAHPSTTDRLHGFLERVERVMADSPTPPRATLGQLTAVLTHHTGPRLSMIDVPTRVLTGDSDILIPPGNSRILAERIPGARLRVIPEGGHIAIHEHPEVFVDELLALRREV